MNFEKHYYFKIDGEEIPFYKLILDENKKPYPGYEGKMYGLENNPSILDVTHLGYVPLRGSVWDGKSFKLDEIDNINLDTQKVHLPCTRYSLFAFLVNNIVTGCISWCADDSVCEHDGCGRCNECISSGNDAIIAAAKSNPDIIYKEVEVE